jgi:hypothetical protein
MRREQSNFSIKVVTAPKSDAPANTEALRRMLARWIAKRIVESAKQERA